MTELSIFIIYYGTKGDDISRLNSLHVYNIMLNKILVFSAFLGSEYRTSSIRQVELQNTNKYVKIIIIY